MMLDNSDKFKSFKESIPKKAGSLPIMPFTNVKNVLLHWLEFRFKQMNLSKPIILLGDYPSQTTLSNLPVGEGGSMTTNNSRGVSVVLLDGSVKREGIGQVINTKKLSSDVLAGEEPIEYGWHEKVQMEVAYWSLSSQDRDYGGDLVRALMLEAFRTGWFLKNGIVEMDLRNYYDTSDSRVDALNRKLSYSVSSFDFTRVFFGTMDYSQFEDLQLIERIDFEIDFDRETEVRPPYAAAPLNPISGLDNGIIILPGGVSRSLNPPAKVDEKVLTICTGRII